MISIGIDPSFTGTGIIVLKDNKMISNFTVITDSKQSTISRVATVLGAIEKTVTTHCTQVKTIISIEGFSFNSKGKFVFQIGYLGFRIRELLDELKNENISWIEIPPNSLKLFATGKGNAGKEVILQQVYKRWEEEFRDNNQADAFVLAKMAHYYLADNTELTEFQIKSMDAVKKLNGGN